MNRPTLSVFRAQFPTEAMGICIDNPLVATYCNAAQERLISDPLAPDEGWLGGWIMMNLNATPSGCNSAYVTTPREIVRLIVMAVCQTPIHIRNGFYEYLQYGIGLQPRTCASVNCGSGELQAFDRGYVPTFRDLLPTPQTIRVYHTDIRDLNRRVLIQGKDQNNQTVLTTDPNTGKSAAGEYISIKDPFKDSKNLYTKIDGIQKDETWGNVQIFQVDPDTGVEAPLSMMEHNEGQANYRRYEVTGLTSGNISCCNGSPLQIKAMGKLDFIPVKNETDYLTIPNVPALIEEALAIRLGRMESATAIELSNWHHTKALQLLFGQLDHVMGKTDTAVRVPIFGSNRLRRQPV